VIQTRPLSGAAKQLGYTTSAVSQQIALLEKSVGVASFERSPWPMPAPTPAPPPSSAPFTNSEAQIDESEPMHLAWEEATAHAPNKRFFAAS
jgi:hypothetical protein